METNTLRRVRALREYDLTDEAIDLTPQAVDALLKGSAGGSDEPPMRQEAAPRRKELPQAVRGLALGLACSLGLWLLILELVEALS